MATCCAVEDRSGRRPRAPKSLPTHVSVKEGVGSTGTIEEGVIEVTGVRYAFDTPEGGIHMEKDVVCGMQVDPAKAAGSSQYNGKTYYFCSKGCKGKFDANPGQFVK
jgi:YHS domain-containing protein